MLRFFSIVCVSLCLSCEPPRGNLQTTEIKSDTNSTSAKEAEQSPSVSTYKPKLPKRSSVQDSLIDAVQYEDTTMIITLVKRGANVNARDKNLFYPLYWAQYEYRYEYSERKDSSTIKTLLRLGAIDYNAKLADLFNASRNGNLDSVKLLLSQGFDVNAKRIWYDPPEEDASCYCFETPIASAAFSRNTKLVQFLLERGAEINFNENGLPPLSVALRGQDYAMADLLLQRGVVKEVTFAVDEASFYSYHYYDTVYLDYLIKHQIPYASFDGSSPLRDAASIANLPVLKRLIPITSKQERNSALCFASSLQVAELLLENGADVNSIYSYAGEGGCQGVHMPLASAVGSGDLSYVKFLAERGANVNLADSYLQDDYTWVECRVVSPLTIAIQNDKKEIAEYLITRGANVNFIIKDQEETYISPLIAAVQNNNVAITKLLLSKGALTTNGKVSIKDYISDATLREIVSLLDKGK